MTGNLVSLGNHLLDHVTPLGSLVNGTLVQVGASDEESSLCVVGLKKVQKTISVEVRTIVVGDCNRPRLYTVVDATPSVGLIAELSTGSVARTATRGNFVRVAGRAVVEETVWRFAVILSLTAPYW